MAKAKIKSKTKIKKTAVKTTKKKAPKTKSPVVKKKKAKTEQSPEIIFDSRVGKTDALFVSDPEPTSAEPVASLPKLGPDIENALKEFDDLQKSDSTQPETQQPSSQTPPEEQPQQEQKEEKKKSWWKKIFNI